jgi:hypothetical protein
MTFLKTFRIIILKPALLLLSISVSTSSGLFAQVKIPENVYMHCDGVSGQKNYLTLDLHKFSDSIFGTYYHRKDGALHFFNGKMTSSTAFAATEKNGDSISAEFLSIHKIKGIFSNRTGGEKSSFLFSETDYFGSMTFETFRNTRNYDFADKPLYPKFRVDLLLLYPEGNPNRTIQDSVQDYILGYYFGQNILFNPREKMLEFLSSYYYQGYAAHYKIKAFEYRSSLLKWLASQDIQVLFNENFVLSICIKQNIYNWNNDPLWDKTYIVFNLKTGQKITAQDIFIPGFQEKLKSLLTKKLINQFDIKTSPQSEGFYKQTVNRFDNLFVTREGIGFHYNPGLLAPAVFGETDIFFTFDELKDILLTKGLVYTLVQ